MISALSASGKDLAAPSFMTLIGVLSEVKVASACSKVQSMFTHSCPVGIAWLMRHVALSVHDHASSPPAC